jgi:hypothetical protein
LTNVVIHFSTNNLVVTAFLVGPTRLSKNGCEYISCDANHVPPDVPDIAVKLQCVDESNPNRLNKLVYPMVADNALHPPSVVTHRKSYCSVFNGFISIISFPDTDISSITVTNATKLLLIVTYAHSLLKAPRTFRTAKQNLVNDECIILFDRLHS